MKGGLLAANEVSREGRDPLVYKDNYLFLVCYLSSGFQSKIVRTYDQNIEYHIILEIFEGFVFKET